MSESARILEQTLARLFDERVDAALLATAEGGVWPAALWRLVDDQGLTRALLPEERGGMGAGWPEAFVIVRTAGRHSLPIPLPETIAAGWLLATTGLDVPNGPLTLAGAHAEDRLRLARAKAGWRLSGIARHVPWGRSAKAVVLALQHRGKTFVVLAPRESGTAESGTNLAGEARDTLTFQVRPVEAGVIEQPTSGQPAALLGALLRSAQIAGALAAVLERSVGYANERHQFGRPIGRFQAIQHGLAILASEAAAVDLAAEAAFRAFQEGDPSFRVAVAKVRAGLAVSRAVGIAHQVHGAIGFTREYPLHWATRRLMSWRAEFGGERQWALGLGRDMLALGADGFWPYLAAH